MEKENTSESGTDIIKGTIIPDDVLIHKIHVIRDQKVMLDSDLAGDRLEVWQGYHLAQRQLKSQVATMINLYTMENTRNFAKAFKQNLWWR